MHKLNSAIRRARYFHHQVEEAVNSFKSTLSHPELIQCKKGCSACCHTGAGVTEDEAELMASLIRNGISIDPGKLERQANVKNWYSLSYEERGCIFLNEERECLIYNDRPAVCRTNHVLSDPKFCETKDGIEQSQRILLTDEANMLIAASFIAAKKTGMLANLVFEKIQEKPSRNLSRMID